MRRKTGLKSALNETKINEFTREVDGILDRDAQHADVHSRSDSRNLLRRKEGGGDPGIFLTGFSNGFPKSCS